MNAHPFDKIGIHLMGKYAFTVNRHYYILTVIDQLTVSVMAE